MNKKIIGLMSGLLILTSFSGCNKSSNSSSSVINSMVSSSSSTIINSSNSSRQEQPHVHKWDEIDRTSATCTEDGLITYLCIECEEIKSIVIEEAKGHTEVVDAAVEATCTETGLTEGKHCSVCGEVLVAQEEVEVKEHNYIDDICNECGYNFYTEGLEFTLSTDTKSYEVSGYTGTSTDVVIPSIYDNIAVTKIASSGTGFRNCSSITSVAIPDSVTYIGSSAFSGCSSLVNIEIPNSIIYIGSWAFRNCSSLTNIEIPSGVTSIKTSTFEGCSSLTNIEIPDSVTSIDSFAFDGCNSLKSIIIPARAISHIPKNNLENVTITSGESIYDSAFEGCKLLTNIIISSSVIYIGSSAFSGCSSLVNITIPDNVKIIGSKAFAYCSSLTNITIPEGVISIGWRAFYRCNSLKYNEYGNCLYLGNNNNPYLVCVKANNVSITTCEINEKTKIILEAFRDCSSLASITIPDGAICIVEEAFYGCSSLKYNEYGNCLYLGNNNNPYLVCAKANNVSITTCEINEKTKIILTEAFRGCSSLASITIPDGAIFIGAGAFFECESLKSITIPNSVICIDRYAFSGCESLKTIYYTGTREQWKNISINSPGGEYLTNATIVYNYVEE